MSDTFTHSSGTAPLTNSEPIIEQTQYQLTYTITERTTGSITISFGGVTTGPFSASGILIVTTENNAERFTVTPTFDFDGTCTFSLRTINHYRDSCQWTELVNCIENCGEEEIVDSEGLWGSDSLCPGTRLTINLLSPFYVESEFDQEDGAHVLWVYSDQSLYGIVADITESTASGSGYKNEYSYTNALPTLSGEWGEYPTLAFSAVDYNLASPITFTVSAIKMETGPKREFDPISCFVLGGSQCI